METTSDKPLVEGYTTVDMLIERLGTHPDEFFNASRLPLLDGSKCLEGVRWRKLVGHLCNAATTGMFSLEEKSRFAIALDKAMRVAFDALLIQSIITGESMEKDENQTKASGILSGMSQTVGSSMMGSSTASNYLPSHADWQAKMDALSLQQQSDAARNAYRGQNYNQQAASNVLQVPDPWYKKIF
jgi:hypothetical protein